MTSDKKDTDAYFAYSRRTRRRHRPGTLMERILIIEDETADAHGADGRAGSRRATACCRRRTARAACNARIEEKPDLILLDIMMPKLDGYAVCAELRRLGHTVPILMLTAKGQVEDRVTGLDVGADDYLVKPFSTEELLARVRALLRRVQRQAKAADEIETRRASKLTWRGKRRFAGKNAMHLTAKEFAMLRLMAEARRRTGLARAIPGRGLGLHRLSDDAHGGQPHRQPAGQAGGEPGRRRAGSRPSTAWATSWNCRSRDETRSPSACPINFTEP